MTESEAIDYLHGRPRFSSAPSLDRIRRLMARLGNPQDGLQFVHIAGTNGKGSTAAMIASCLQRAGKKTGLFTSPYLVRFEERYQIDGVPIEPDALTAVVEMVRAAEDAIEREGAEAANEFELVTAVGFCWFRRENCDFVVLEVGLGGRDDPTNLIRTPACACIMSISLDHMQQLGNTVAEIAGEKAGIIKPGGVIVTPETQNPEALAVLKETAAAQGARLLPAGPEEVRSCGAEGSRFRFEGQEIFVPLLGRHQIENAAVACRACRVLGLRPDEIAAGIAATVWPGRLQMLSRDPLVVVDAAHNRGGIAALTEAMDTLFAPYRKICVIDMMRDKEYAECVPQIASRVQTMLCVQLDLPRALPAGELAAAASCCADVRTAQTLRDALTEAVRCAGPGRMVLVCGSVYLAGAAIPILREMFGK